MADNTKKILVAVSDKDDIASYGQYLNAKGFNALLLKDDASAVDTAVKEHPVIIITEVSRRPTQSVNGEKIFNPIKDNPHTKAIPFIFIAEDVVNIKGFRKELDSLFIKPINMDELFARINQCLAKKDRRFSAGKEIEGRLSHMSLVDILQVLHMNRKEGALNLTSEDKKGLIYMKDGEILNASIGDVEKEKALFRLLKWKDGRFEFLPKPVDMLPKIQGSFDNLLMEGMRQYDELEKNKEGFPKADAVLKIKVDLSILPKGLRPIIYEVLYLIESCPRIEDLVNHCPFPDYEVYQTITDLIKKDIIEETEADELSSGSKPSKELLSLSQALMVKEKITSDSGKIMLLYSDRGLAASFVDSCRELPRFAVNRQFASASDYRNNPLGEVGLLKIHSGAEIIFFAVPMSKNMLPLIWAFSDNAVGSVLILRHEDPCDAEFIKNLSSIKKIPAVYTIFTKDKIDAEKENAVKRNLGVEEGIPVYISNMDAIDTFSIFRTLFEYFVKY